MNSGRFGFVDLPRGTAGLLPPADARQAPRTFTGRFYVLVSNRRIVESFN